MASSCERARKRAGRSSPGVVGKDASASQSEPPAVDQRFPRSRRLTRRRQFLEVYKRGRRQGSSSFTLFFLPNTVGYFRLGLTVPRKVGNAVHRNRAKRVLRDIFRRHLPTVDPSLDLVINAHRAMAGRTSQQIERELIAAVGRIADRGKS
jgi:ribonuclease P protein component